MALFWKKLAENETFECSIGNSVSNANCAPFNSQNFLYFTLLLKNFPVLPRFQRHQKRYSIWAICLPWTMRKRKKNNKNYTQNYTVTRITCFKTILVDKSLKNQHIVKTKSTILPLFLKNLNVKNVLKWVILVTV